MVTTLVFSLSNLRWNHVEYQRSNNLWNEKRTAMRELVVQLRIKTGDFNVDIPVDGITSKRVSWHVQVTCQNEHLYVYSKTK